MTYKIANATEASVGGSGWKTTTIDTSFCPTP